MITCVLTLHDQIFKLFTQNVTFAAIKLSSPKKSCHVTRKLHCTSWRHKVYQESLGRLDNPISFQNCERKCFLLRNLTCKAPFRFLFKTSIEYAPCSISLAWKIPQIQWFYRKLRLKSGCSGITASVYEFNVGHFQILTVHWGNTGIIFKTAAPRATLHTIEGILVK